MPLLAEYAITPDVLDATSYSNGDVCNVLLQTIKDVLLAEGLIRDLRESDWRRLLSTGDRPWHPRGKELVRKLASQGRLIPFVPTLPSSPTTDREWCSEALATHSTRPFTGGIIVTAAVKADFAAEPLVAQIDRLNSTAWWSGRSPSIRLPRTLEAYKIHLDPILRCANSIMFIDPHLDPTRPQYQKFGDLLRQASGRSPLPLIEIHRVCYEGSGRARTFLEPGEIEHRFRSQLENSIRAAGLGVEVFAWDDFHDRHIVSNLVGILAANGFDTTTSSDPTTWTRLGRETSDDVQREFDPSANRHKLKCRFRIP